MSDRPNTPQNDEWEWSDDCTPRTPNGAAIRVEETPPPAPAQRAAAEQIPQARPVSPGTPIVINDTYDLPTPPGLPPLPLATQARRRTPLQERDVRSVEEQSVRAVRGICVLRSPPPPPATQQPRRVPLDEVDVNATRVSDGHASDGTGPVPAVELHEVQARAGSHVWLFPQTAPRTRRTAPNVSSATTAGSQGSSPLSFDLDTPAGTPSPSIRAAETRAATRNAAQGDGAAATTTTSMAGGEVPAADSTGAVLDAGSAATVPLLSETLPTALQGDESQDLFRHFSTPPIPADEDTTQRNQNLATAEGLDANGPFKDGRTANETLDGDAGPGGAAAQPSPPATHGDDPSTGLEHAATQPATLASAASNTGAGGDVGSLATAMQLAPSAPDNINPAAAAARLAKARKQGTDNGRGERMEDAAELSFVPVASSTPTVATVALPPPPERWPLPRPADSLVMPRPDLPANGLPERLLQAQLDGANSWKDVRETTEAQTGRHAPMDADLRRQDSDSPTPEPPKKGKGKARARTADLSQAEHEAIPPPETRDGWDEAEILEARQRSLRQVIVDRAGGLYPEISPEDTQSGGAGPSHARYENEEPRYGPTSQPARDAHTSRGPTGSNRDRYPPRDRQPREYGCDSTRPWETDGAEQQPTGRPRDERARSAFYPLPNTRAADYLAGRGYQSTQMVSPAQRSPISRVPGLQQPLPRIPSPQNGRHAPEERVRGTRQRQDEDGRDVTANYARAGSEERHEWMYNAEEGRDPNTDEEHGWEDPDTAAGWMPEDGEVLPSALRNRAPLDNAAPTPVPDGGFPTIHRDDPETALRGMAIDWMREVWSDAPNTDVIVQVYNYRYTEDDVLNGRVAEALRWAFEQLSGERGFDVVPPEPEEGSSRRQRDMPSIWVIRGLTPRATEHALRRGYWSFPRISFAALPRATAMQNWLFTLEGFLEGNADKIRAAVLRVLREEDMQTWMAEMIATNPAYAGWSLRRALEDVFDSVQVETMQLGNGTHLANVFIRPPTRSLREWRRWVAELRSRRYRSFAIGTGRVRYVSSCSGCTSVSHPTHLCPFPRIPGWNGPAPGEGVFGERKSKTNPGSAYTRHSSRQDGPPGPDLQRNIRDRRGERGPGFQRDTRGARQRDNEDERSSRETSRRFRGDRADRDYPRRQEGGGGGGGSSRGGPRSHGRRNGDDREDRDGKGYGHGRGRKN
ncbi:hypothetical protein OH76DRAFT_1493681 [Lentinus brumalis]|uniref:Uncharacterized protein n=1 Tax=Lentinus brumalis TaxID=2498619 RepID=A0A371DYC6_9APHY|nr:hypothetical protein OH76DRAFT_1493681 [Polyporus brumalis]